MALMLSSRGTLGWLSAALAGSMSAAFMLVALNHSESLFLFLAYLCSLPLLTAGLGAGAIPGAVAAITGTFITALFASTPDITMLYTLAYSLPSAILMVLAMRYKTDSSGKVYWYPEGSLLLAAVLYPCIVFLFACAMASGEENGLLGVSTRALSGIIDAFNASLAQMATQVDAETLEKYKAGIQEISETLNSVVMYSPAAAGCLWVFITAISGVAAQLILKQQSWTVRPFRFKDFQTPNWVVLAIALTGIAAYLAPSPYDYMGTNLCILLCIPLFFVGLSVIHCYAATFKYPTVALVVFYTLLSLFVVLAVLVTLIGTLDQSLSLRQRIAAKTNRSES